jgi:hypothetical protein
VTLSLALANSGELQVELIQQTAGAASIFTEFLTAHPGGGFQQVAYWTTDFEETMTRVRAAGWPVVWTGGEAEGVRFAYAEPGGVPAAVVEIMELTPASAGMAEFVRAAAAEWGRCRSGA